MANREIFPFALYPLAGDVVSTPGQSSVVVTGLQRIPISAALPADRNALVYIEALNQWVPEPISGQTSSIQVNGISVSDDFFVTTNYTNGYPPFVAGVATFLWADTLPGIVVNATGTWILET